MKVEVGRKTNREGAPNVATRNIKVAKERENGEIKKSKEIWSPPHAG